jgi:hypothetical protein
MRFFESPQPHFKDQNSDNDKGFYTKPGFKQEMSGNESVTSGNGDQKSENNLARELHKMNEHEKITKTEFFGILDECEGHVSRLDPKKQQKLFYAVYFALRHKMLRLCRANHTISHADAMQELWLQLLQGLPRMYERSKTDEDHPFRTKDDVHAIRRIVHNAYSRADAIFKRRRVGPVDEKGNPRTKTITTDPLDFYDYESDDEDEDYFDPYEDVEQSFSVAQNLPQKMRERNSFEIKDEKEYCISLHEYVEEKLYASMKDDIAYEWRDYYVTRQEMYDVFLRAIKNYLLNTIDVDNAMGSNLEKRISLKNYVLSYAADKASMNAPRNTIGSLVNTFLKKYKKTLIQKLAINKVLYNEEPNIEALENLAPETFGDISFLLNSAIKKASDSKAKNDY